MQDRALAFCASVCGFCSVVVSVWQLYQTVSSGQQMLSAFLFVHKEHARKRVQISSVSHLSLPFKCYFQCLTVTVTSASQMGLLDLLWTIRPLAQLLSVRGGGSAPSATASIIFASFFFFFSYFTPMQSFDKKRRDYKYCQIICYHLYDSNDHFQLKLGSLWMSNCESEILTVASEMMIT